MYEANQHLVSIVLITLAVSGFAAVMAFVWGFRCGAQKALDVVQYEILRLMLVTPEMTGRELATSLRKHREENRRS